MFHATVWIPGTFKLNNVMLSDLRAAGHFEGRAKQRGQTPRPGHDLFAAETENILLRSLAAWKGWKITHPGVELPQAMDVSIVVVGHERHDFDAWYLLGKAAVDGACKALGLKDRRAFRQASGRVHKREEGKVGFWMDLKEVEP